MRILCLLLVLGCDDNTLKNESDASVDLSVSGDAAVDLAGGGAACDLVKQDCGTGMKCALTGGGMMTAPAPTCVAAGTAGDGQPCTRGMMGTPDNCAAGLVCARQGAAANATVCRKICTADSGCDQGQKCAILSFNATDVGQCLPSCEPFSTTCGALTCAAVTFEVGATQQSAQVIFTCRSAGMVGPYGDCMRASDCGANSTCSQDGVCTPFCDNAHACVPPGDGGAPACMSLDTGLAADPGTCG